MYSRNGDTVTRRQRQPMATNVSECHQKKAHSATPMARDRGLQHSKGRDAGRRGQDNTCKFGGIRISRPSGKTMHTSERKDKNRKEKNEIAPSRQRMSTDGTGVSLAIRGLELKSKGVKAGEVKQTVWSDGQWYPAGAARSR